MIARLCGLALSNLKRQELERRQLVLDADIAAARQAQLLIVPASEGVCGPLRYAMQMRPGHFVAGDLFDVIQIDEDRSAVCIGDVTGEGVGAAVIMAATQGHLHGALLRSGDPAAAVNDANRYIASRTAANKFVSLWVGVFDVRQQRLTYVDAGHGYWYFTGSTRPTEDGGRGIPAGIESDYHYDSAELPLACGDRVIMYSDGLVEQRSPSGEPFGQSRVEQSVSTSSSPSEDIERMITSIESFAGRADFDDDTTVASVEVMR